MKARCAWQLRGQRSDRLERTGRGREGIYLTDYKASSTSNHFPVQAEKSKPPSEAAPKPQLLPNVIPFTPIHPWAPANQLFAHFHLVFLREGLFECKL